MLPFAIGRTSAHRAMSLCFVGQLSFHVYRLVELTACWRIIIAGQLLIFESTHGCVLDKIVSMWGPPGAQLVHGSFKITFCCEAGYSNSTGVFGFTILMTMVIAGLLHPQDHHMWGPGQL